MSVYIAGIDGKLKKVAGNFVPKENPNLDCLRTKILWTNPNPNNAFNSQNIVLSSGDYDGLFIEYFTAGSTTIGSMVVEKGFSFEITRAVAYPSGYYLLNNCRTCTRISDTEFNIGNADVAFINANGSPQRIASNNSDLIPYKIYGIYKSPAMIYTGKELFNDPVSAGVTRTGQHDTVSEYYMSSDGNTWYRIWASGWKECGGKIAKGVSGQHKVTFPLTFSNTNFTLLKTLNWQANESVINRAYFGFQSITTSSAYTYSYTPDGYDESWYACGY